MPEIPDIEAYIEALRLRLLGRELQGIRLASPFALRTVDPPLEAVAGGRIEGIVRLGKRIVLEVTPREADGSLFLVIHLMIAGRLRWKKPGAPLPRGSGIAAFDFVDGTLVLTEAGTKRRASLHLVRGQQALAALDPGGVDLSAANADMLGAVLRRTNQTLKRALTDPGVVSGIGNAYSDEILHKARLSPFKQTRALNEIEIDRLHRAATEVLAEWTERLRLEARESFPEKVTAFRPEMAVHGRFGSACPVCGASIERIVYAENECNYCPGCQTEGRILADRALSRLLKDEWPNRVRHNRDQEV